MKLYSLVLIIFCSSVAQANILIPLKHGVSLQVASRDGEVFTNLRIVYQNESYPVIRANSSEFIQRILCTQSSKPYASIISRTFGFFERRGALIHSDFSVSIEDAEQQIALDRVQCVATFGQTGGE